MECQQARRCRLPGEPHRPAAELRERSRGVSGADDGDIGAEHELLGADGLDRESQRARTVGRGVEEQVLPAARLG